MNYLTGAQALGVLLVSLLVMGVAIGLLVDNVTDWLQ